MAKKILVAEDSMALAGVICLNLQLAGYDVTVARDGEEGWQAVQAEKYDLIVTDQQMPKMNGDEMAQHIAELDFYRGVPIIMLTAKGFELDEAELQRTLGIQRVLAKPFSPTHLVETIENCLSAPVSE